MNPQKNTIPLQSKIHRLTTKKPKQRTSCHSRVRSVCVAKHIKYSFICHLFVGRRGRVTMRSRRCLHPTADLWSITFIHSTKRSCATTPPKGTVTGNSNNPSSKEVWLGFSTAFPSRIHNVSSATDVRALIDNLAPSPLTHAVPSRVSDHVAIRMVRGLRWCADRLFREKFLHRALLLKLIAPAPGSGGSSAEHWRCTLRGSSSLSGANDVVCSAPAPSSTSSATDNSTPLSSSSSGAPPADHNVKTISQPLFTEDIRRILFHWKDNQLMHMHIVMTLTKTSFMERLVLQLVQACMYAAFVVIFSCSRRFGFRLCGYLLEESSVILTHMVNDIDMEKIRADVVEVPQVATRYWGVDKKGMRPFVAAAPTPPPPTSSAATQHHAEVGAPNATSDVSQPLQRTVTGNDIISTSPENIARAAFPETGSPQPSETLVETAETVVLTLRDVVLLMRADDMQYRDLLHSVANRIDDARDRGPGEKKPRSPFS